MSLLDWISVFSLALSILSLLGVLVFIFLFFKNRRKLLEVRRQSPRKKSSRRKWKIRKVALQKKGRHSLVLALFGLLLAIGTGCVSFYTIQYQSTHLSMENKQALAQGYSLIQDLTDQVDQARQKQIDGPTAEKNIATLSTRISAFAIQRADRRLGTNEQAVLNRYFASMTEFGVNISRQPKDFYQNDEQYQEFKGDLKRVERNETDVFKLFQINQKRLEK